MTIRFAAAQGPARSPVARVVTRGLARCADNDNSFLMTKPVPDEQLLRASLRHFGEHGLGAARAARAKAEDAFFAGDRQSYDWWLGITRTLDRRLALEAERGTQGAPYGPGQAG